MSLYKKELSEADNLLFSRTGKHFNELEQEAWYECDLFIAFMEKYVEASLSKEKAYITLGRNVYPLIKKTAGLPDTIKTPYDLLVYEAKGFELNHRGNDVVPRKFIKVQDRHIIIRAPSVGYHPLYIQGVFIGILEMFGIRNGRVVITKGVPICEYDISW